MGKVVKENRYWLNLVIIFTLLLFTQLAFGLDCKKVTHIDFKGRSIIIETKDGSIFTRYLTNSEYKNILSNSDAQDILVDELLKDMECGKNKFSQKEDPNL